MGGNVDRGGGREGKGKSLRNNKKEIADKVCACSEQQHVQHANATYAGGGILVWQVKALQKGHLSGSDGPCTSAPPPPIRGSEQAACIVDCGVQLLNRQFDRDQLKASLQQHPAGPSFVVRQKGDRDPCVGHVGCNRCCNAPPPQEFKR